MKEANKPKFWESIFPFLLKKVGRTGRLTN